MIIALPSHGFFSVQSHLLPQGRAACKGGLRGAPAPPSGILPLGSGRPRDIGTKATPTTSQAEATSIPPDDQ